jgi:ABC-2 type transport system permease protein
MQAAMHKVLLVIQREYLARVKKKSFLVATLLTPLIFPAIMAVFVWIAVEEKENQSLRVIEVVDESGLFFMESSDQYAFSSSVTNLEEAKALVTKGERYGALYSQDGAVGSKGHSILWLGEPEHFFDWVSGRCTQTEN